ncbi:thioredoxin-like protein [Aspergillus terricola var. indicus]
MITKPSFVILDLPTKQISLPPLSSFLFSYFLGYPSQLPTISFIFRRLFGSFAPASPATMSSAKVKAQQIIDENGVVVFSKSYCPYCKASKSLLSELGANYYALELDTIDDGADLQNALEEISGQRTVPNIYIAKKHIGGNSDLQGIKKDLPALLKDAGAL